MLEHYYVRPDTIDRIRTSWIAGAIERYVDWLTEHRYAPRNVFRRVPVVRDFGDFARARGATAWEQLPAHIEAFVETRVRERGGDDRVEYLRRKMADEARNAVEQKLRLGVACFPRRACPPEPVTGVRRAVFRDVHGDRGLRDHS